MAEEAKKRKRRSSEFRLQIGEDLIGHMSQGYSFRSFAHAAQIPYSTLVSWSNSNKNFQGFKERAEAASLHYWETVGIAAVQGQLQRVKSETVKRTTFLDEQGNVSKDGAGVPLIREETLHREHEATGLNSSMWTFVMRSRFGWQPEGPDPMKPENNPGEALKRFQLAYNLQDQPYVIVDNTKEKPDGKRGDNDRRNGSGSAEDPKGVPALADPAPGVGADPEASVHHGLELRGHEEGSPGADQTGHHDEDRGA